MNRRAFFTTAASAALATVTGAIAASASEASEVNPVLVHHEIFHDVIEGIRGGMTEAGHKLSLEKETRDYVENGLLKRELTGVMHLYADSIRIASTVYPTW